MPHTVRRTLVYDRWGSGEALAVLKDGVLDDFLFSLPDSDPAPGTVILAAADRRLKGQGAWLVRLQGRMKGYLRTVRPLQAGARLLVQVSGYPDEGKLTPVSDRLELSGRFTIVMNARQGVSVSRKIGNEALNERLRRAAHAAIRPHQELGVIVRSSAALADDSDITEEIRSLVGQFPRPPTAGSRAGPRIVRAAPSLLDRAVAAWGEEDYETEGGENAFERHSIDDLLDAFQSPVVDLANGGSLVIETTRALTAVDVNSGADTSRGAALKSNIAAVGELPRQLRIRGIGGQIVVDFAPLRRTETHIVHEALEAAFAACRVSTTLVGWTRMGLFEMHRHRSRLPLTRRAAS